MRNWISLLLASTRSLLILAQVQLAVPVLLPKLLLLLVLACTVPSLSTADLIKLESDSKLRSVYLLQSPGSSVTTVALTILAGEVDFEGPEGLSHYLEHLMFWHADGRQIHARGGNAWVDGIVTSYYNEGEKSDLADMLEFAARLFSPPDLDKSFMLRERSVVAREYDLRVSENPNRRIQTKLRKKLYNNLAVSRSVIGTPASIHSLTLAQAWTFHKNFYHPINSVLFLSGNLEKREAEDLVNSRFGDIGAGVAHKARWREARIEETADSVEIFTDSQVLHQRLMYLTLSQWPEGRTDTRKWYTLWLLQSILDSALEGGVAGPLRMDNFVLRSFDIGFNSYLSDYFELLFFAEPDRGVSLTEASTAIADTITTLADTGIPESTLERVRTRLLQTEVRNIDSTRSHYGRMSEQLSSGLTPVTSREHLEQIKQVSLKDVNALLRALANPERRAVAHIKPAED